MDFQTEVPLPRSAPQRAEIRNSIGVRLSVYCRDEVDRDDRWSYPSCAGGFCCKGDPSEGRQLQ
jgi:hypothetical protein